MPIHSKIILASSSPRRAEILRNAGFEFSVMSAEIDESWLAGEGAATYVERLAEAKAQAVASQLRTKSPNLDSVIVGADTTVAIEGEILGKPESEEHAGRMLRRLSGRWHEVLTGLAVVAMRQPNEQQRVAVEKTRVEFAMLSEREIEDYIKTREPFDKAGAYAIQGRGGKFIPRIEGCYFNVMGLPLARLYAMLKEIESGTHVEALFHRKAARHKFP